MFAHWEIQTLLIVGGFASPGVGVRLEVRLNAMMAWRTGDRKAQAWLERVLFRVDFPTLTRLSR